MAGDERPLGADLVDWPPDLFALTSLVLQRSGLSLCAVAAAWAPVAARITKRVVDHGRGGWSCVEWRRRCPGEQVPPLLVSMMEVVVAAARTPLEELFTGADWDLCAALLTLHAIADEACAGLGVALAASNPLGCGYRGRAREPAGTCPRRRPRRPGRSPSPTPAGYASY